MWGDVGRYEEYGGDVGPTSPRYPSGPQARALYPPHTSPVSPPYLPRISPISPPYLGARAARRRGGAGQAHLRVERSLPITRWRSLPITPGAVAGGKPTAEWSAADELMHR